VILSAGLAGNLAISTITDRARQTHPGARLAALAGVSLVGLLAAAGFYSLPPTSWGFYACWLVSQAYLLGWYGSLVAAVDDRAPDGRRAAVLGFVLLAINLLGVATGPYVTGLVADRASLSVALLWSLTPAALGALVLLVHGLAEWRPGRSTARA
jgi:MFS family permease